MPVTCGRHYPTSFNNVSSIALTGFTTSNIFAEKRYFNNSSDTRQDVKRPRHLHYAVQDRAAEGTETKDGKAEDEQDEDELDEEEQDEDEQDEDTDDSKEDWDSEEDSDSDDEDIEHRDSKAVPRNIPASRASFQELYRDFHAVIEMVLKDAREEYAVQWYNTNYGEATSRVMHLLYWRPQRPIPSLRQSSTIDIVHLSVSCVTAFPN